MKMIKKGKIRLWSFLVFGIIFLLTGVYLYASGKGSEAVAASFVIVGTGQLIIFNVLFFLVFRKSPEKETKK